MNGNLYISYIKDVVVMASSSSNVGYNWYMRGEAINEEHFTN